MITDEIRFLTCVAFGILIVALCAALYYAKGTPHRKFDRFFKAFFAVYLLTFLGLILGQGIYYLVTQSGYL